MRIIFYEMKKIWSFRMVSIIALISVLFFSIFMLYTDGHPATEAIELCKMMTQKYGTALEADELVDFMKIRDDLIAEANNYINRNFLFKEAGIHSYADYEKVYNEYFEYGSFERGKVGEAIWVLLSEEADFVQFWIQELNNIQKSYLQYDPEFLISYDLDEKQHTRLFEIRDTGEYKSIMNYWIAENTVLYTVNLSVLAILLALVLFSPLVTNDRSMNVHSLQYASRQGRKTLKKQLFAVILSSWLLTTILLTVFLTLFLLKGYWIFWNNGLTSFLNGYVPLYLFPLTYGQYIILYVALVYVLCLGSAAGSFILSRFSRNVVTLILKLIPLFILLCMLCYSVFYDTWSTSNLLYIQTNLIGVELVACILVFVIGLTACFFTVKREKKADV